MHAPTHKFSPTLDTEACVRLFILMILMRHKAEVIIFVMRESHIFWYLIDNFTKKISCTWQPFTADRSNDKFYCLIMAEQLVAKFSNLPIKWHKTQDRMSEASCVLSEWMTNEDNPLQYLAKCKHELLHKVLVGTERGGSEKYCLNTMGSSKSISLLQTCSISAQQIQCSKSDVPSIF